MYEATIPIHLSSGESHEIAVRGVGFVPGASEADKVTKESNIDNGYGCTAARPWTDGLRIVMSDALAMVSQEIIDMGDIAVKGVSCRLVEVTNQCMRDVSFEWKLDAFRAEMGLALGRLTLDPWQGSIAPGDTQLVKIQYEGGLQAEILDGTVRLLVRSIEDQPEAEVAYWESHDVNSEEIIAEDPPRGARHEPGMVVGSRLPVHASTTKSIRGRLTPIRNRHEAMLTEIDRTRDAHLEKEPLSESQVIIVTIKGCVAEKSSKDDQLFVPPIPSSMGTTETDKRAPISREGIILSRNVVSGIISESLCSECCQRQFESLDYDPRPFFVEMSSNAGAGHDSEQQDMPLPSVDGASERGDAPLDMSTEEDPTASDVESAVEKNEACLAEDSPVQEEGGNEVQLGGVEAPDEVAEEMGSIDSGRSQGKPPDPSETVHVRRPRMEVPAVHKCGGPAGARPEFQLFADYVLGSAIYALLQESAYGE
ncbi:unnamed protein product [Ostreobium quekettii]|uniref:Uncharacterized protein n=1 Tax=Ostreobium quekettii TaxID=121088 RepID=A0A8S1J8Y0_9CHLO|nr:unnamed protein product [Ostreobium quekettii]